MPNFFIKKSSIKDNRIELTGDVLHHLRDSLRIKTGEQISCVDEEGTGYTIKVSVLRRELLTGEIISKEEHDKRTSLHINLVQSLPKGPKFDFIIQKSTELGVTTITPVVSERSVVKLEKERGEGKHLRWERIALEAAQQSGRRDIPDISQPAILRDFLSSYAKCDLNLLLWEGEKIKRIKDVLRNAGEVKSVTILVGPEGGFSDKEVELAVSSGFIPVSLGELILRTETAPIVALSILQYEFTG
ncbi:MAG: 16S rRNA (uracil(1498)-N(3))-methyltransferase [Nitrospirae bacterium]|nr:16S rRNA (uracil(1498)-N(3))-methyltransferase [Nitrospirota bacterium]